MKYHTAEEKRVAKREQERQYRLRNKDKVKERQKKYQKNNLEYFRDFMRKQRNTLGLDHFKEQQRLWRENNPAKRLLQSTRNSAKQKGLDHNITPEDLNIPEYCPYLGIKIDYTAGNGKTMEKPSVDRIDPTKGYIKGNVEVISSLANTMKSKANRELLLNFANEVIRRYG